MATIKKHTRRDPLCIYSTEWRWFMELDDEELAHYLVGVHNRQRTDPAAPGPCLGRRYEHAPPFPAGDGRTRRGVRVSDLECRGSDQEVTGD